MVASDESHSGDPQLVMRLELHHWNILLELEISVTGIV